MRYVPERSAVLQITAVFGGFFIGPWASLQAGLRLVPESDLVQTVGVFTFALIFVGGTLLWTGIGIVTVVVGGLWRLIRGRLPDAGGAGSSDRLVPPGYRAYIVLGCFGGGMVGVLAGMATELTVLVGWVVWTGLGAAYGFILWAAAHHGYLPFLEPE